MAVLPKVKTITGPAEYPVTLEEAKEQAIIEHSDNDVKILQFIGAATNHVQRRTNTSLVRQQKRVYLDKFYDEVLLSHGPVKEIEQVQYIDADGVTQTLATSVYEFSETSSALRLAYGQTWPAPRPKKDAVWIDYWAGYYDTTVSPINYRQEIPDDLKLAVLMLVAEYDRNREAENEMQTYSNKAFEALIQGHREYF